MDEVSLSIGNVAFAGLTTRRNLPRSRGAAKNIFKYFGRKGSIIPSSRIWVTSGGLSLGRHADPFDGCSSLAIVTANNGEAIRGEARRKEAQTVAHALAQTQIRAVGGS
jgi:hypothetical protein